MAELCSFLSWTSAPEAAFWFALSDRKLNEYRLDDSKRNILAYYLKGEQVDAPARLCVGNFSFGSGTNELPRNAHVTQGTMVLCNTIEIFRALDFSSLADNAAKEMWASIVDGRALEDPSLLNAFVLATFADLKKHHFHYWFSFPALRSGDLVHAAPPRQAAQVYSEQELEEIYKGVQAIHLADPRQSVFVLTASPLTVHRLNELPKLAAAGTQLTLVVADPAGGEYPGWPIRSAVVLAARYVPALSPLQLLCLRQAKSSASSLVLTLTVPVLPLDGSIDNVKGWEKNLKNVQAPRTVNLSASMDPKRLAESAVDLNLRLMKWRVLPDLDLAKISGTRCLLIGAGTLGCNVARGLMGWGVRRITFVDSGKVSFSNPVRQSLFTFEDCLNGGRDKAIAAAERLTAIFPSVEAKGVVLSLPMPGHPVDPSHLDETYAAATLLDALISDHDAVFLLTDSRESRWLPAMLCAAKNKICITAAVGFDTFVTLRHGLLSGQDDGGKRNVGCYFCSDVVAPVNSVRDRTLDQQCTVSRPGVSLTVSALAVELLASIVSHPLGGLAPASDHASVLGVVPHQIRGVMNDFTTMVLSGHAFDKCTACSARILAAHAADPKALLAGALNTPEYLEKESGLAELHNTKYDEDSMLLSDDSDAAISGDEKDDDENNNAGAGEKDDVDESKEAE